MKKKILVCICLVLSLVFVGSTYQNSKASSTNDAKPSNMIKAIKLNKTSINLTVGKKTIITAKPTYTNTDADVEGYTWSTNKPNIATVSKKGVIYGKAKGTAYIYCTSAYGAVKVRAKVVVRNPYNKVKAITFTQTKIRVGRGDKRKLNPSIIYHKNSEYTPEPVEWKSSNKNIAKISSKGVVKGKKKGTCTISLRSKFTGKRASIKVTVGPTKYIAFTFDDGPGPYTNKLVSKLKKYNAKATFFMMGNKVRSNASIVRNQYNSGMEIGSHSYSHPNFKQCSKPKIKSEISKTNSVIKSVIGVKPTLLRPPYGNYNKTVSKYAGVPMVYWTIDTLDWKYRRVNYVKNSILNQATPWAIVLLHDIHPTSVNGFIKALPKLKKRNYELVTVSELYQIYGKKMKDGKMYYGPIRDKKK